MTDIVPIRTLADDRKLHSHIPELDGLRAVAVLAVMLFHKGTIGFDLGWVGVNLFFVLSGFLITGILLDAKGSPNYFRNFYIRRILRIFPIYYLTLMIMYQPLFANQRGTDDGIFYLFYLQNYIQGIKNWQVDFCYCYNHTWSLAVEEQFYIVWPFIVYKLSKKNLGLLIPFLFFSSLLLRIAWLELGGAPLILYTGTPFQIDSLMVGASISLLVRYKDWRYNANIIKYLIGIITASFVGVEFMVIRYGTTIFRSHDIWTQLPNSQFMFTLLALGFGGLIFLILIKKFWLSVVLSWSWVNYLGKISYGLYLYHPLALISIQITQEMFSLRRLVLPEIVWTMLYLGLSVLIASVSWNIIEKPILRLKDYFV